VPEMERKSKASCSAFVTKMNKESDCFLLRLLRKSAFGRRVHAQPGSDRHAV